MGTTMRRCCVCRTYSLAVASSSPCSIRRARRPCSISLAASAISRAVAYSRTTECSVKLPRRWPRSSSERRRSASTASSICTRGRGAPSTSSNSSMVTGSRRIASHSSTVCSTAERRANCSSKSSRTLPTITSPCSRNGAISPPKSSTMVSATILRASGLPTTRSISCSRSWTVLTNSRPSNNCALASPSSPERRKARTGVRLPSRGTSSRGFSREVSSRQPWCSVWATRRSSRP